MLGPNDFDVVWDLSLTINNDKEDDNDGISIVEQYHNSTTAIKLAHAYLSFELQNLQYEELGEPRGYAAEVSRRKERRDFVIPPPVGGVGKKGSGGPPGDDDERRDSFDPGREDRRRRR
jgi:hypothetical protein